MKFYFEKKEKKRNERRLGYWRKWSYSSTSRHSDANLAELGNEAVKEDDSAVLLEGGGLQSASPRSRSSSTTSPIFRFLKTSLGFLKLWTYYHTVIA